MFYFSEKISPVLVTAIHDGHFMREELRKISALNTQERMREEDPYTAYMAEVSDNRATSTISRFETDLNRLREGAIYKVPEDAWGLNLWKENPSDEMNQTSLRFYDAFYVSLRKHLQRMMDTYGRVVVLDLHTYNHRRNGPFAEEADPIKNPEINVGNAKNAENFRPLLSDYNEYLANQKIQGEYPEVGENVKFDGGGMAQWIFENFAENVCTISIEFKKTFMDEWTGVANVNHLNDLRKTVGKSVNFLKAELTDNIGSLMADQ